MDVSHFNYKIYIVTLNVIVYVEAHLYIMLHNDFEKIPNVIIIKFGYNARCHWLKERTLEEFIIKFGYNARCHWLKVRAL